MPRKTKYASDLKPGDYTFHPSKPFQLSLSKLKEIYPDALNNCHLVALDQRQINVLLAMASVFPKFYWVWGLKSPQSSWDQATWDSWSEIEDFVTELETCLMSGCDLNEWLKQQRMLTAAIVGEAVDLTDPLQLSPDAVDFTIEGPLPGLVPKIDQLLNVDRALYPDMNVAEVLFEGLIGRRLGIGIPFEGTGLADIADEQLDAANIKLDTANSNLDTLHNRFRMTDSSLFNPLFNEKNITETLETLLRRDKFTDLEFLTPNIVTVLENLFQIDGGSAIMGLISGLYEWITGEPLVEIPEAATTAEILMLIAGQLQKNDNSETEIVTSLAELKKIRQSLEISLDDGQGTIVSTDLAGIANRIAITLDRLRDNLDVVSDDGKEFGLAAVAHYYSAELVERIDRIRDNLDTYIDSEQMEFGIASLLDGLNRLSFTATEYLRCIAEAMNEICPPNVDPPTLPYLLVEGGAPDDDWSDPIRAEHIANDPDEGRDELEDETFGFFFGIAIGVLVSVTVTYETPADAAPYVAVEIRATGRIDTLLVWATGSYRAEHSIIPDETETALALYQFNIYPSGPLALPPTGTVHVQDLDTDDTLTANWS